MDPGEGGLAGATITIFRDGPGLVAGSLDANDLQVGTAITTPTSGEWAVTSGLARNNTYFVVRANPSGLRVDERDPRVGAGGHGQSDRDEGLERPDQGRLRHAKQLKPVSSNNEFLARQNQAAITFNQSGIPTGVSTTPARIRS